MDLNHWPSGYEPDELPDCSIPHWLHSTLNYLKILLDNYLVYIYFKVNNFCYKLLQEKKT